MAAPIVVPFNHNPTSTTIKTASYTIPSGKYARINCLTPLLTINGIDTHRTNSFTVALAANTTTTVNYPMPEFSFITSYSITRSGSVSGSSSVNIYQQSENEVNSTLDFTVSRSALGTTSASNQIVNVSRALISIAQSSGFASATASTTVNVAYSNNLVKDTWFPSGTVLNGYNIIVEEYNQIS